MSIAFACLFWGAVFYVVAWKRGARHIVTQLGGGMLAAAILSNLFDATVLGGVRNFMELGFDNPLASQSGHSAGEGTFGARPSFSLAALGIWVGIAVLIVGATIDHFKAKKRPVPPPPPKPGPDGTRPHGHRSNS